LTRDKNIAIFLI